MAIKIFDLSELNLPANKSVQITVSASAQGFEESGRSTAVSFIPRYVTIDGDKFPTYAGQEWEQWLVSKYNTASFEEYEGYICVDSSQPEPAIIINDTTSIDPCNTVQYEKEVHYGVPFFLESHQYVCPSNSCGTVSQTWNSWIGSGYNIGGKVSECDTYVEYDASPVMRNNQRVSADDTILPWGHYEIWGAYSTPTVTLKDNDLTINDKDGLATSYNIYVDGVLKTTINK